MTIRRATVGDVEGLARCIVDTWLAAHHDQIPGRLWERRRDQWTYEVSAAGWARTMREIAEDEDCPAVVFAAVNGSEVVGLVMGTGSRSGGPMGEINALYVFPHEQGHGLGKRLLASVFADLAVRGIAKIQVAVLARNESARGFYEQLGGRLVARQILTRVGWRCRRLSMSGTLTISSSDRSCARVSATDRHLDGRGRVIFGRLPVRRG